MGFPSCDTKNLLIQDSKEPKANLAAFEAEKSPLSAGQDGVYTSFIGAFKPGAACSDFHLLGPFVYAGKTKLEA